MRLCKTALPFTQKRFFWKQLLGQVDSVDGIKPFVVFNSQSSCVESWKSYDDRTYKGKSCSMVEVIKDESLSNSENIVNFTGKLVYNEDIAKETKAKGTFCAFKGNFHRPVDFRDYEGLSLTVRSVGIDLSFLFNLYCESQFDGDLYQLLLQVPKDELKTFHIPFSLFKLVFHFIFSFVFHVLNLLSYLCNSSLTANGVERESQRLNDSLRVKAIGILVKDKVNFDFNLQIKDISVIPTLDQNVLRQTLRTKRET